MSSKIQEFHEAKKQAERIIDTHMQEAFKEISQLMGGAPTSVRIHVETTQRVSDPCPTGIYVGCETEYDI